MVWWARNTTITRILPMFHARVGIAIRGRGICMRAGLEGFPLHLKDAAVEFLPAASRAFRRRKITLSIRHRSVHLPRPSQLMDGVVPYALPIYTAGMDCYSGSCGALRSRPATCHQETAGYRDLSRAVGLLRPAYSGRIVNPCELQVPEVLGGIRPMWPGNSAENISQQETAKGYAQCGKYTARQFNCQAASLSSASRARFATRFIQCA